MRLDSLGTVCCAVAAFAVPAALAADPHPLTVHDLVAMQRISSPQPSPDGKQVAFVVRDTDLDANRGRLDLWLVGIDGSDPRRLTADKENDEAPSWSPDGKWIYFLAGRSGSTQVWRIPVDGGEASRVTDVPVDVNGYLLSPDGTQLVIAADTFPDCATLACTAERLDAQSKVKASGRLYDRLFVRHWDTWWDKRRSHLFVVPVAGGEPLDLMKSMDADAPTKPFGGFEEIAFTPDGRGLVFTAKDAGLAEAWSTNYDLWLVPVDGSAPPKSLTARNKAWDSTPAFSPDGKTLAYLAMERPGFEADRFRIMLRGWPDGSERQIAASWDRSPGTLMFSADGRTLFVTAPHLGQEPLFAIDIASGKVRQLVDEGFVADPALAGDVLVFGLHHLRSPVELFTLRADGSARTQITRLNAERLAALKLGQPEQFTFRGAGGDTVYGYVVKPAEFEAGKKYPIAFLIHGGPQGSFGNDWHYRWNPQTYAGAGYAVVMIDFHGSTGYGQAFTDAIRGDWGGKPLEDLNRGLAAAIQKYPFLDGDRACALGASYGGYMINWIAGAWPDRFRCLVVHDGNIDERMAYFDTEELWFPEWEHGGTPWDNPEGYAKHNPVDLVKNWKTPTLVVHGGRDYRVVDTQGLSTFTALQRKGIPSQFLHFPDENHWVLKPHNSILWHETVLAWLDRWTKSPR
ncbi:MAG: S9 family peptidase [Acidobacteria bacterium]|nr:S9 family peptidase [Acidobacteriota bacterium]